MRRRRFLEAVGQAGVALGALPLLAPSPRSGAAEPHHWVWVHGNVQRDPEDWRLRFERLAAAGVRGVLVSGGNTGAIAAAAREQGLGFHRWIWVLNRAGDSWVKENHPEWFTVSRNGDSSLEKPPYVGYYQWLCPSRPEVRQYLGEQIGAAAQDPSVDGIHLDYIRHADVILPKGLWAKYGLVQDHEMPEFDFCYCEVCRAQFRQRSGTDPLSLPEPSEDPAWRRFRWDSVTGLVRDLAGTVHSLGKPISAAVFPTPAIARRLVRQAWDEWPVDAVFPMAYHTFHAEPLQWIGTATEEGRASLPGATPLYTGLHLPDLSPDDLGTSVELALSAGAAGVSLFEMDDLTDAHLASLRSAGASTRQAGHRSPS